MGAAAQDDKTSSDEPPKQQQQQQHQGIVEGNNIGSGSMSNNNNNNNNNNKKSKKKNASSTAGGGTVPSGITTAVTTGNVKSSSSTVTGGGGGGIDAHPYQRGSVIEVWHGKEDEIKETYWWSDSDDDDDEDDDEEEEENEMEEELENNSNGNKKQKLHHHLHSNTTTTSSSRRGEIRMCDVIDRVMVGGVGTTTTTVGKQQQQQSGVWRYYVHYRDFNRRLDEWISMDRIVSPPSVGNAKARAMKKEEEKLKRKKLLEESHHKKSHGGGATGSGTGIGGHYGLNIDTSHRRSVSTSLQDVETPRLTRRQRRKTGDGPDGNTATAAATGSDKTNIGEPSSTSNSHNNTTHSANHSTSNMDNLGLPETVKIATSAVAETTVVGQHVIATIPAQELDEHEGLDEASLREHEEVTKIKNVAFLELGEFCMETWYYSPLPKELLSEQGYIERLFVCEFSLNMFARKKELLRYQARELPKQKRYPPGNEIYRNGNLAMFEVDGFEERIYCQNLCYIAKLFLDHKTLYFDVDPFLFYVLCEVDHRGFHPVGYYSKEKYSDVGYNLACILTFPSHQRKGYGRFLIAFSYALSQKEERVGSPEKPISDLGQKAYKPYWMSTIVDFLRTQTNGNKNNDNNAVSAMSIMDISKMTSIMAEDIVFTLNQLGILKIISGVYFIAADEALLEELAKKHPVKEPRVDPSKLHWTPFITEVKRDKFSIHSKKPTVDAPASVLAAINRDANKDSHK